MTAAGITKDPARLAALCALWRGAEQEVWLTLQGYSMMPALPPGTRVRLCCRPRGVQTGEIVAFRRGGALVIHRLVTILNEGTPGAARYVCRGDANAFLDPAIAAEELVGVVREFRLPPLRERFRARLRARIVRDPLLLRAARAVRRRLPPRGKRG